MRKRIYMFFKRVFDIIFSFLAILILGIPMLFVALIVRIDSKGGAIFKQERIGKNGKVFKMLKFRTMILDAEKYGVYSDNNDSRFTKVGKFLRISSIDELPQLINILKGDMSFIGPRPVLTYHPWTYDKYNEHQLKMFKVRPGLTGWTQVNGRRTVEWHKRIEMNVWYVENISLLLDIKIFFKTIFKVLKRSDNENLGSSLDSSYLSLMYITNNPEVALIAEKAGVDRIFIDMEYIGKDERQKGLNSVKNHHTIEDILQVKKVVKKAKVLVRVNPIHDKSEDEINNAIRGGADIVMLPMFKTVKEVETFVSLVAKRAKVCLLVETKEAVEVIDDILKVPGIDEIHIGLNDLHLSYGLKFMFELLDNGKVEELCSKFKNANVKYGFGGISRIGSGDVPAEFIIAEHYRLKSTMAILSRSFCDTSRTKDIRTIESLFNTEVKKLRLYEDELKVKDDEFFKKNREILHDKINRVCNR